MIRDIATVPFVRFTEHNDWEGETWNFYIPLEGNKEALHELYDLVKNVDDYELDMKNIITNEQVNALINHGNHDSGYMDTHNKLSGVLDMNLVTADGLYKGGISRAMIQ